MMNHQVVQVQRAVHHLVLQVQVAPQKKVHLNPLSLKILLIRLTDFLEENLPLYYIKYKFYNLNVSLVYTFSILNTIYLNE